MQPAEPYSLEEAWKEWTGLPPALFARGVELGQAPLHAAVLAARLWWPDGEPRHISPEYNLALLRFAPLTEGQRDALEREALAYARRCAPDDPEASARTYAGLVTLTHGERLAAAHAGGREVVQRHRGPIDSSPNAVATPRLFHRDLWQALMADEYPAWLRERCAPLLERQAWRGTKERFLRHLGFVHLLEGEDFLQAAALALDASTGVFAGRLSADREEGIGGLPKFTAEEIEKAEARAGDNATRVVWRIIPAKLHEAARRKAISLGLRDPGLPAKGQGESRKPQREHRRWFSRGAQIPHLTLGEKHAELSALPEAQRALLIQGLVRQFGSLIAEARRSPGAARLNPRQMRAWTDLNRLNAEYLPVGAPFLTLEQVSEMLRLWRARDG